MNLPEEILFRIFSYLEVKDLLLSTSRVCSYWYAFTQDDHLWRRLNEQSWGFLSKTQSLLRNMYYNGSNSWRSVFKSNFDPKNLEFLVVGAEAGWEQDERLADVKTNLKKSGLLNVDVFNARTVTPDADCFSRYNAILFFSYHGFNQTEMGNMLAQYVDNGGGVVIATYSNCGRGNRLEGRWKEGSYDPIQLGQTSRTAGLKMGKSMPNHPVLKGVKNFSGGSQSSHGDGCPHPKATLVAEWDNGRPLIAELNTFKGTIVSLNFYPPSEEVAYGGWDLKTDGARIIANSLLHVSLSNRM